MKLKNFILIILSLAPLLSTAQDYYNQNIGRAGLIGLCIGKTFTTHSTTVLYDVSTQLNVVGIDYNKRIVGLSASYSHIYDTLEILNISTNYRLYDSKSFCLITLVGIDIEAKNKQVVNFNPRLGLICSLKVIYIKSEYSFIDNIKYMDNSNISSGYGSLSIGLCF